MRYEDLTMTQQILFDKVWERAFDKQERWVYPTGITNGRPIVKDCAYDVLLDICGEVMLEDMDEVITSILDTVEDDDVIVDREAIMPWKYE